MSIKSLLLLATISGMTFTVSADSTVDARHQERRKPLKLICATDGMEVIALSKNIDGLRERTEMYNNTQVSTMFVCLNGSFGKFFYDTKAGDPLLDKAIFKDNLTPDMIAQGIDPLKFMIDIFHAKGRRVICSFRMNDTHDYAHAPDSDYYKAFTSKFKQAHPELLCGKKGDMLPVGRWSSLDYASPLVRAEMVKYAKEACDNYDIDGIELNAWRHLPILKSVACGGSASHEEIEGLTAMMRDIRRNADLAAKKRGRPILIVANLPDSLEYSLEQGFDLETYMREDLIDIWTVGGYFELNQLEYSLALGKKYGTEVCPVLYESRISDIPGVLYPNGPGWPPAGTNLMRHTMEAYRGRAAIAYDLGCSSLGIFNKGNPKYGFYNDLGDYENIKFKDKLYFASYYGGVFGGDGFSPDLLLKNGRRFLNLPTLSPNHPLLLTQDKPLLIPIRTAEKIKEAAAAGFTPVVDCYVRVKNISQENIECKFNERTVGPAVICRDGFEIGKFCTFEPKVLNAGKLTGEWLKYEIKPESLQNENILKIMLKNMPVSDENSAWDVVYESGSGQLPKDPPFKHKNSENFTAKINGGILSLNNKAGKISDFSQAFYYVPSRFNSQAAVTLEAEVQVKSGSAMMFVGNGAYTEYMYIAPDRAGLISGKKTVQVKNNDFAKCRLELKDDEVSAWINGEQIAQSVKITSKHTANQTAFGPGSNEAGISEWKSFKFRDRAMLIQDVMLFIKYQRQQ